MPSPSATPTPITPPRVPIIDPRTGLLDRAWYMFFYGLFNTANKADIADNGPNVSALIASYAAELETLAQAMQTAPQPDLGSMAPLMQDNVPWMTFNTAPSPVPTAVGSVYWDGGTTLGIQATSNVLMRVGESEFVYVKASSAITKGQLCYHTGAVGGSGVITAAPTPVTLSDPNAIIGVAAETIALNGFGLIQVSGDLRGFDTTGTSVGETWADGDPLYYNPAYVGSLTKTKPGAPNQKTYVGEVINASSGGSGSINIRIVPGSILGGTDSNVQFGTLANNNIIVYDSGVGYWKNITTGTGVVTALGVNVDTAGAFVVNGGALGTPSSGTVTNLTGTASININGTVGATTPNTGAFTTAVISTSSATDALRITQAGSGNSLVVEDSTNPDATPFVIDAAGVAVAGHTAALDGYAGVATRQTSSFEAVGGNAAGTGLAIFGYSSVSTTPRTTVNFNKSQSTTIGSHTLVLNNEILGAINFNGSDGTQFVPAAQISVEVDGAPGANDMPGRLVFSTTADGASTATERVRIDNAGYTQFSSNLVMPYQAAPTSKNAAATLTGAELVKGILNYTGAAATITLPTGTDIEGGLAWSANNIAMDWWVINTGSGTCTIGANGNTTVGTLTIVAGASGHFRIRRTATNTFTVYRLS